MIFFDYDVESKSYRYYNPYSEKVLISRDVRLSTDQGENQDEVNTQNENSKILFEISSREVNIQEESKEVNCPPSSARISQRATTGIPTKD